MNRPANHDANSLSLPSTATTTAIQEGTRLFDPGSGQGLFFIVRTGCVRLFKTLPDGRTVNLGILGPNTVFTQEDGSSGVASGAAAEAMVDSTISIVPTDELAGLIAASPDLAASLVTGMTRRLTDLQTLVEHLLVRDTSVRLALTLLTLASRFGKPANDNFTAITIPITHRDLAGMTGANRVTISRKLLAMQDEGLVRPGGRMALTIDVDGLRAFIQSALQHGPGDR